ncbi:MAG: hypothetical protein ACI9TV_002432 [Sulfurimonas sp.]|jgi:hypothetical protein|uniref:hypothetical protein n=1 Tax=Sulfurimonas sp. TaxID=2022749 RepID=UPI0039E72731
MNEADKLSKYLNTYFETLEMGGSGGSNINLPPYDLMPHDYLSFVDKDNIYDTKSSIINTVGHLKRALECQLDVLLFVLGLDTNRSYSHNIPKKLDFLDNLGLLTQESFKKLNTIRNNIEHKYYLPDKEELDTFYDLTFSLINSIEWFILSFSYFQEMEFTSDMDELKTSKTIFFEANYSLKIPSINFCIGIYEKEEILSFNANNYDEFIFAFSTYILLIKSTSVINKTLFLKEFNCLHERLNKK